MSGLTVPGIPAYAARRLRQEGECIVLPVGQSKGYTFVGIRGGRVLGHRLACEAVHGPAPFPGAVVDHAGCDNRRCVNPAHLVWATQRDNILRGAGPSALNARKPCCPQCGAEYRSDSRGHRHCPPCHYRRQKARRARNRAAKAAAVAVELERAA